MKLPSLINKVLRKPDVDPGIKDRVLKNNDAVLDVLSKNIRGARSCPFLGGQKCIGQFCEHYMEFVVRDEGSQKEVSHWQCVHTKMPMLTMELNRNVRELTRKLDATTSEKREPSS